MASATNVPFRAMAEIPLITDPAADQAATTEAI
jgi:hypothetical protein